MLTLEHSTVYRGGVTANAMVLETRKCSAEVDLNSATLDLRFRMASKGGGTTRVLLEVGFEDVAQILEEMAREVPEFSSVLMRCASTASERDHERFRGMADLRKQELAKISGVKAKLTHLSEIVTHQYFDAPPDNDKKEKEIMDLVDDIEGVLSELEFEE